MSWSGYLSLLYLHLLFRLKLFNRLQISERQRDAHLCHNPTKICFTRKHFATLQIQSLKDTSLCLLYMSFLRDRVATKDVLQYTNIMAVKHISTLSLTQIIFVNFPISVLNIFSR